MSTSSDLEREVARLRRDLERYRLATEAALDTLDEAIGWLDRNRRTDLARALRRSRETIRRRLRAPDEATGPGAGRGAHGPRRST